MEFGTGGGDGACFGEDGDFEKTVVDGFVQVGDLLELGGC